MFQSWDSDSRCLSPKNRNPQTSAGKRIRVWSWTTSELQPLILLTGPRLCRPPKVRFWPGRVIGPQAVPGGDGGVSAEASKREEEVSGSPRQHEGLHWDTGGTAGFFLQVLMEFWFPLCVQEMTQAQMVLEKITLQKCLLYFESVHGRPVKPRKTFLVLHISASCFWD